MALGGVLGNGTRVGYSATSPVSWVRVAQLLDIPKFIQLIAADISTTVHGASRLETSMPGMIPVPEVELDVLLDLDPATSPTHEAIRGFQTSGATVFWRVEIPVDRNQTNFRAFEFNAYVKAYDISTATQIAAAQRGKFTLRYGGGLAVYAPGAAVVV
jgi:hypothetical protein